MAERQSWAALREQRMAEPGAEEAYDAARLAFELGAAVRALRLARGWSQAELASVAGMTQSAVARFEVGGTVPTLPVLGRIARALGAELTVRVSPGPDELGHGGRSRSRHVELLDTRTTAASVAALLRPGVTFHTSCFGNGRPTWRDAQHRLFPTILVIDPPGAKIGSSDR